VCTRLGARPVERVLTLHHHYFLLDEIRSAFDRAGFVSLALAGNFEGQRTRRRDATLVLRAIAP
jgi:hypothetical protein